MFYSILEQGKTLTATLLIAIGILWLLLCPADRAFADDQARWCPDDTPSCTYYDTIQEAVDAAEADHKPGLLIVENGTFDESVSASKLKDVSIASDGFSGPPTITGSLSIDRSTNIIVSHLVVNGGIHISHAKGFCRVTDNTASLEVTASRFTNKNAHGLSVSGHDGDISLSNVSASKCDGHGAYLSNNEGSGSVTLSNCKFDKNGVGVIVSTRGAIRATNVSASKNEEGGANLTNELGFGGIVKVNVSGRGKSRFDKNGSDGLVIYASNTIEVTGISACNNKGLGARLVNTAGGDDLIVDPGPPQGNRFDHNGGAGLYARSHGGIYLADVRARGNGEDGVFLSNIGGSGNIEVDTWVRKQNQFDKNAFSGLNVQAVGSIRLTDITCNRNLLAGAILDNSAGTGDVIVDTSRSRLNSFGKNGQHGIKIDTTGAVSLFDIDASGNDLNGIWLDNAAGTGSVTLQTRAAGINRLDKNGRKGLEIRSSGSTTIIDLSATKNTEGGVAVDHQSGTGSGDVTIGTSAAKLNRFDRNGGYGLWVSAGGAVDATDISASKNADFGALLGAGSGDVSLGTVNAKLNRFDHNGGDFGLRAVSGETITLVDVSASGNSGMGAYLRNHLSSGGVTITTAAAKRNLFEKNGNRGLSIESGRSIRLEQIYAKKNGRAASASGLYMSTSEDATLTCSTFTRNSEFGVVANVSGDLYLNRVTAADNTSGEIDFFGSPIVDDTVACP